MSCSGGKTWYVCSVGPFRGCCSVDPCNTGVCPNDDNDSNDRADKPNRSSATTEAPPPEPSSASTFPTPSITTTLSTATKTTASQSTSTATPTSDTAIKSISTATSTSTSASESESLSPNSVSAKDTASTTQTHTGLPTASPTRSPASSSGSRPSGGLIGGVVAGIVAALILICLLFCLIRRSRKKRGKRFTLLRWHNPAHERNEKGPSPTRSTLRNLLTSPDSHAYESGHSPPQPGAAESHNDSVASPRTGTGTLGSLPSHSNSHSIGSTPSLTVTPPSSTTLSTSPSTLLVDPVTAAAAAAAVAISSSSAGPSTRRSISTRTTTGPGQLEPTPELSDTGFYRQRAELAAYSSRELINVPLSQRQRPRQSRASPRQSQASLHLAPTFRAPPAKPIVTADGVVLTPNMDSLVKDSSNRDAATSDEDHVMSFMRYDAAKDSELPAYRASWRRSLTGSSNVTVSENVRSWQEKERERERRVSGC